MKYQFVLETGNWKPGFWNPPWFFVALIKKAIINWEKKFINLGLTAEPCRKPKANNQQLLRNKSKLKLKYEVKLKFENQIWKPGADLKMKNLEMKSWIPGLRSKVHSLPPFWQFPTTYYPYCQCLIWKAPFDKTCCELRNKRVTWKCW